MLEIIAMKNIFINSFLLCLLSFAQLSYGKSLNELRQAINNCKFKQSSFITNIKIENANDSQKELNTWIKGIVNTRACNHLAIGYYIDPSTVAKQQVFINYLKTGMVGQCRQDILELERLIPIYVKTIRQQRNNAKDCSQNATKRTFSRPDGKKHFTHIVISGGLNLRSSPNVTENNIIKALPGGTLLIFQHDLGYWLEVITILNKKTLRGFVAAPFVMKLSPNQ